jgi:hypothetical protein
MRIKVTGYIEIDDDEFDAGPMGPLTDEAHLRMSVSLGLDDIEFEVADVQ